MNAIVVQVRMGSTRLPGKVLKPFFKAKTILDIVVENAQKNKFGWEVIVATTSQQIDDEIEIFCNSRKIKCFRGSENDVLKRFMDTALQYKIEKMIRVCADNPFLNTQLIDALIEGSINNSNSDYISHFTSDGMPSIKTHWGVFAEFVTYNALCKVYELTNELFYQEHVTNYIYANPQSFKIVQLEMPIWMRETTNIRFTVDTPDDFSTMVNLYSKFYPTFNLEKIVEFVKTQPEILAIMDRNINQFKK
jgi:spore coat polysaccharide biosynthesis protein SpsF